VNFIELTKKIQQAAKDVLGDRLEKIILFGSHARGDHHADSDIDFFILANVPQEEANGWRQAIRNRLPGIDLEFDLVVCLHVVGSNTFNRYRDILPFYRNVMQEGVVLGG
jgi:predicted nucleotidyltransferase